LDVVDEDLGEVVLDVEREVAAPSGLVRGASERTADDRSDVGRWAAGRGVDGRPKRSDVRTSRSTRAMTSSIRATWGRVTRASTSSSFSASAIDRRLAIGFRISWAKPATIVPIAASRSKRRRSISSCFSWVRSWKMKK
jgi:hypothetical protein